MDEHFDALPPVDVAGNSTGSGPVNNPVPPAPTSVPADGQGFVNPAQPSVSMPHPLTSTTPATNLSNQPAITSPMIADDIDLIEKEWVDKAKQIVEHTKNDPYLQNEEITKFKRDYQKKRYNRDIDQGKS